jgi:phosphoserine phosphatase RsbU/P
MKSPEQKERTILVVEDTRLDAMQVRLLLEKAGYRVLLAMNAEEAIRSVKNEIPDLVILDIMLPDKSGWEVCSDIKEFTSLQGRFVPVILLTSLGDVEDKVIGFESGADDYLVKPPAKKELLARIRSMIRIRDLQEHLRKANRKLSKAQRIIKRDINVVAEIQRSFLPQEFPRHPELQLAAFYQPSSQAGGDYYDIVEIDDDHFGILIADIAGHGVSAAVVMAITQLTVKEFASGLKQPGEALLRINEKLNLHLASEHFVTMFYAILNHKTMDIVYTSAGHNPMLYYAARTNELLQLKTGPDFPLHTFETKHYEEKKIHLAPGDKLLLFTDGVLDVQNSELQFYGQDRLEALFMDNYHLAPTELLHRIVDDTEAFRNGKRRLDDFTLFAIGRN